MSFLNNNKKQLNLFKIKYKLLKQNSSKVKKVKETKFCIHLQTRSKKQLFVLRLL